MTPRGFARRHGRVALQEVLDGMRRGTTTIEIAARAGVLLGDVRRVRQAWEDPRDSLLLRPGVQQQIDELRRGRR